MRSPEAMLKSSESSAARTAIATLLTILKVRCFQILAGYSSSFPLTLRLCILHCFQSGRRVGAKNTARCWVCFMVCVVCLSIC